MPVENVVRVSCDVCGIEKKKTNHWFQIIKLYSNRRIKYYLEIHYLDIEIMNLEHLSAGGSAIAKIVCGEECMSKQISKLLGESNATK